MNFFRAKPHSIETDPSRLLESVNRKNTAFLVSVALLSALSFVMVVALLVLSYQAQDKTSKLLESQSKTLVTQQQIIDSLNGHAKERSQQIDELQQHINCIVTLFTMPNRASLTITDISGCQLSANGTITTPSDRATVTPQASPQPTSSPPAAKSAQSAPTSQSKPSGLQNALDTIHNVVNKLLGHL